MTGLEEQLLTTFSFCPVDHAGETEDNQGEYQEDGNKARCPSQKIGPDRGIAGFRHHPELVILQIKRSSE
ncbi:hypothetical protein DF186_23040, partial [Enterococcus hirae]